jgi:hypothetical protein
MQQLNKDDLEKEVTIKLKKWQIPYLLGAARLGIWNEDWCAGLIQTAINSYDTHSARLIMKVAYILDEIKKQTGITDEDKEYACNEAVNIIQKWVDEECLRNEKASELREAEWLKENQLSDKK